MSKLTVTIPDDLHQKIREELERQGITTSQFIEQAVTTFFEKPKGVSNMATRTLAFQVSEELLQRIKTFLARYEQIYHRKLSQKEFLVHLIERELDEAEKDYERITTEQAAEENADVDSGEPDGTEMEVDKVELNSPKLEYGEMEKLQEVVRALRRAGGKVNSSCGMHVHVDASKHTPQSLKNVLSIMYSKEDILFAALKVNPARIDSYCQAVDEPILEEIRKLPSGASMDQLKDRWYQGRDGSDYHYHSSRYRACNMHSVFYHGTIEWRLFNSTLHAGEAKANIILAMAISAQGINQKYTQFRKTPIGDNPAFTFRTFLLRLGLIGPEYKNVRMHLLKNLPGDKAWRHDKSQYPSNQPRPRTGEVR